jgi:serine/threonine protein phosphatase 1
MIYAVGDIHGRADLLDRLMQRIVLDAQADGAQADGGRAELIFLGDYMDRGPQSRRVLDRLIEIQADPMFDTTMLRGNHDQYFLEFMRAPQTWTVWRRLGAAATLQSYGVTPPAADADDEDMEVAADALRRAVSAEHVAFLKATKFMKISDRHVFVHAGVRPGVALESQDPKDLMSIRSDFLHVANPAPDRLVIYGHSPIDGIPGVKQGKLGIDTGAYATGVLTAAKIAGETITLIDTRSRG